MRQPRPAATCSAGSASPSGVTPRSAAEVGSQAPGPARASGPSQRVRGGGVGVGMSWYRAVSGREAATAMLTLCQKPAGVATGAGERLGGSPLPGGPGLPTHAGPSSSWTCTCPCPDCPRGNPWDAELPALAF